MPAPPALDDKLRLLPDRPGVYLFKDGRGRVLYVGKARSLRSRVRSYFQASRTLGPRLEALAEAIADVEWILTDSEVEALVLENHLIKKHRPKHNIRLRDDKQYPYLRVTMEEEWPRVLVVRQMKRDGSRYFGPYTSASAMRETLRVIRRAFPFRACSNAKFARCAATRPCLDYYIGRCLGPCRKLVTRDAYLAMIEDLCRFLEGRQSDILKRTEREMHAAAERLEFERAAELRNQLQAMEKVVERQKIELRDMGDYDAVAMARGGNGGGAARDEAGVQVFLLRDGKLVGREYFVVAAPAERPDGEVLQAFLQQFYERAAFVPREILVQHDVPDREVLEAWLAQRRGAAVRLRRPQRGEKRALVELVAENARTMMAERHARAEREQERAEGALEELAEVLGLEQPPERIECYDVSNLHGWQAVGSMVVFEAGRPKPDDYRRFRVRTVVGPNDFAMLQEVLDRRFRRAQEEQAVLEARPAGLGDGEAAPAEEPLRPVEVAAREPRFAALPDLIVIDGGIGQLHAALEVLQARGVADIPVIGLAKRFEHVFLPGRAEPLALPRDSAARYLLQRIRDEAHRFAVQYHRTLRAKRQVRSTLDDVPGVGKTRRTALLRHFGSTARIREASLTELAKVPGMTRPAAEAVYRHFHPEAAAGEPGTPAHGGPAPGEIHPGRQDSADR